jgi:hypothetical protein
MTFNGIISKFASREYNGKTYWDLVIADSSPDPRTRFLSEDQIPLPWYLNPKSDPPPEKGLTD